MIDAKELRLGNILQRRIKSDMVKEVLDGGHEYFSVDTTMMLDCDHYKDTWAFGGVPLTPELLHNCPQAYGKNFFELTSLGEGIYLCFEEGIYFQSEPADSVETHRTKIDIKYLHQFQNLYFALTGTELEVVFNKTP